MINSHFRQQGPQWNKNTWKLSNKQMQKANIMKENLRKEEKTHQLDLWPQTRAFVWLFEIHFEDSGCWQLITSHQLNSSSLQNWICVCIFFLFLAWTISSVSHELFRFIRKLAHFYLCSQAMRQGSYESKRFIWKSFIILSNL